MVDLLQKPGMDVADGYVTFVRHSQDMLREKVSEEVYVERLFDVSKPKALPSSHQVNVTSHQGHLTLKQ